MMKKIISLTKVLCKEHFEKLKIYNKKNIFFWLIIILNISLGYLSYEILHFLNGYNQSELFLDIFLLILNTVIIFQTILSAINIFYYSKDLEYILPFPFKPIELLISKFNTVLSISYVSELIFATIPLIIYGLLSNNNLFYFFWMIIILLIFPILSTLVISTIMLFIMKLSKFIKNKDVFQLLVTTILVSIVCFIQMQAISNIFSNQELIEKITNLESNSIINEENNNTEENKSITTNNELNITSKFKEVNNYFLIINPSTEILTQNNNFICLINIFKILIINLIFFVLFIIIGKKLYLKNILKNLSLISTNKINKNNKKYTYKKTNKNKAYIKNEFKTLIKNPTFFMQCIFPTIIFLITISALIILLFPVVLELMQTEEFKDIEITFDTQWLIIILIIIQTVFTFSNISLTAVTRKGKNAIFMKYIPISLYKQFLFMNIPQIFFNNIFLLVIIFVIKYLIPEFSFYYLILIFILGNLLNILNSILLLIVDLLRPNINWNSESLAIKQNENKLFQYVLTIIIILLLIYFKKIFEGINFNLFVLFLFIIFTFIILVINLIILKNLKKLFKKII